MQDRTGVSYMFSTHDIAIVRVIADGVVVMKGGGVMDKGPRQAVLQRPRHPYIHGSCWTRCRRWTPTG